jgi:hypothetical protein
VGPQNWKLGATALAPETKKVSSKEPGWFKLLALHVTSMVATRA